jgi:DNA-binding XRE family transcriptional regulator
MKKRKTKDAAEIMDRWFGGDAEWDGMVLEEELKARIGQLVYTLRTEAGLTQTRLGEIVGTTQEVISKVENADYDGSALEMLFRVCVALKKRFTVCGPGVPFAEAECGVAVNA